MIDGVSILRTLDSSRAMHTCGVDVTHTTTSAAPIMMRHPAHHRHALREDDCKPIFCGGFVAGITSEGAEEGGVRNRSGLSDDHLEFVR